MTSVDRWILPEGVDELLPQKAAAAERLRRDILDLFSVWGYQLIIPPLIEFTDSLLIGLGKDIDLQSFRLTDQLSGKPMAVRADITPQAARIDAHSLRAEGVNRLCYAGSVLHTRPKSQLASRCPIQVGAELYGDVSDAADSEVICLMLQTVQLAMSSCAADDSPSLTLDLGHVAIYSGLSQAVMAANPSLEADDLAALFDAVQRKSLPDLKVLLPSLIDDPALAETIYQLPSLCGDISVLSTARTVLQELGSDVSAAIDQLERVAGVISRRFDGLAIYFDLAELRGYEYHTGLVFAAYTDGCGSALANGGRYDHIGEVFGAARPATGFNVDLKALLDYFPVVAASECSPILAPDNGDAALWQFVCTLREAGQTVVFCAPEAIESDARQLIERDGEWRVE